MSKNKKPKFLLCNPKYFTVNYSINPWMSLNSFVDGQKAFEQWRSLKSVYQNLECEVSEIDPVEGLPDMVFTANAGLIVKDKKVIVSSFKNKERQGEERHFQEWFYNQGYSTDKLKAPFEGVAEAFPFQDKMLFGYGQRAGKEVIQFLKDDIEHEMYPLHMINPNFYHLDMCLATPRQDLIFFYPGAFDDESIQKIKQLNAEVIEVTDEDANAFGCNFITVDDNNIVIGEGTVKLKQDLQDRGFEVHELDMSEFRKSGGGVRCLTFKVN